jgi:hypothetical protein
MDGDEEEEEQFRFGFVEGEEDHFRKQWESLNLQCVSINL